MQYIEEVGMLWYFNEGVDWKHCPGFSWREGMLVDGIGGSSM
jgi:hypothetical protein